MVPEQRAIRTDLASPPGGPYSQAVRWGQLVFTASVSGARHGQEPPPQDDIPAHAANALANLQAILEAAGASLANVLHVTVYLRDGADLAMLNEVYQQHFTGVLPARSLVIVTGAQLPIAFDAVACVATKSD